MNIRNLKCLIICILVSGVSYANHNKAHSGPIKDTKYINGEMTKTFKDGRTGTISWKTRYITAKGMAPSPPNAYSPAQAEISARTAAILDAQRYLLEMTQGVQVDVTTCVSDYMVSEVKRKHIQGVIKNFEITEESWKNGIYRITMQIPMGKLIKVFVNDEDDKNGKTNDNIAPKRQTSYTGLVIDARRINLTPAIRISIYSERGKKICGPMHTTYHVTGKGIEEISDKRLGNNPLRLHANGTSDSNNVDIVISDEDANRVRNNILYTEVFSKGRFFVLID
jgi:hypothetical protein